MSTDGWLSDAVEKIWVCDGRDGRVAVDHLRRHAAHRLDPERQRGHVEEQDVLDLAAEDAGLDRRADRHDLVGVDALVRLLAAEHLLDRLDHRRHAGHAADQDDLVDVAGLHAGVGEGLLDRPARCAVMRSATRSSSLARVSVMTRCFGPGGIGADERAG